MQERRKELIRVILAEVESTAKHTGVEALDERVVAAMASVPRHEFVPEAVRESAYLDIPLPTEQGQTISQPYIVALMTHLLDPREGDCVMEVGGGTGYQAAVLSRLVKKVVAVERIPELADSCRERLARLGYDNVEVVTGDGVEGHAEEAPYGGIMVTAAARRVEPAWARQLQMGRYLVMPMGEPDEVQQLVRIQKREGRGMSFQDVLPVRFVPLRSE